MIFINFDECCVSVVELEEMMAAMRGGSSSFRSSLLLRCWGDVRQLAAANRKYLSMHQQKGDENQLVQYSVADSVATITLNDPKHLNALTGMYSTTGKLSHLFRSLIQVHGLQPIFLTVSYILFLFFPRSTKIILCREYGRSA